MPPATNTVATGIPFFDIIFLVIIPVALAMTIVVFCLLWFMWMPDDAKKLFWLKRSKSAVAVFMAGDEGRMRLWVARPMPQGVLYLGRDVNGNDRYAFLPRRRALQASLTLEQKTELDTEWDKIQSLEDLGAKQKAILEYTDRYNKISAELEHQNEQVDGAQDLVGKRCFLAGIPRPVFIGYSGKTVAVSPETLATLTLPNPTGVKGLWHGHFKKDKEPQVSFEPTLLIDPRALKSAIPAMFTDSQMDWVVQRSIDKGRKLAGSQISKVMLPLMAIVIIIIVAMIVLQMSK